MVAQYGRAIALVVACIFAWSSAIHASLPVNHWHILAPAAHSPAFYWPSSVAVDRQGRVDILDRGNDRVVQLSPAGKMIRWWGGKGSKPGQLGPAVLPPFYDTNQGPPGAGGLAVDARSNVYVADTWNHRIEKFSPTGVLLATWTHQLSLPVDLALDRHGTIFVADEGTNQIVKLSPKGTVLDTWTDLSVETYGGLTPFTLTVSADGVVYVVLSGGIGGCDASVCWDGSVAFLEAYSSNGQAKATLVSDTCVLPEEVATCSLAIDRDGNLLVTSGNQTVITRFAPSGKQLAPWDGLNDPRLLGTTGMAIDGRGNLYTVQAAINALEKRSLHGKVLAVWGIAGTHPGQFVAPQGLTVNAAGMVAVFDAGNQRVQVLSSRGAVLAHWRVRLGQNDYGSPSPIAMDGQGDIFRIKLDDSGPTCTSDGCVIPGSILKYSKEGKLLATWTPALTPSFSPVGLTVGQDGMLYVAEASHRVVELSTTGDVVAHWSTLSDADIVGGIAADSEGRTYVVEQATPGSLGNRIEVFIHGKHRALWRHLPFISQLAAGTNGGVYAAEPDKNRIVRFSSGGHVGARWGSAGFRAGQFHAPSGVAVNAAGELYVSDSGNDRIQKLMVAGS
jgi:tripartite motif-containing protein 71